MDLICTRCGEPWDLDYVLHEEPRAFKRHFSCIHRCPCCPPKPPELPPEERTRLEMVAVVAHICGDDIDAAAAMLEDLNLL